MAGRLGANQNFGWVALLAVTLARRGAPTGQSMKLHGNRVGSNCRRVTIYLAEKGLELELVEVDLASGEHKSAAFRAKNPAGLVPVLELDDGTFIPESSAIVEYLEDKFPAPTMIGDTPEMRGKARALERIASDLAIVSGTMLQHSNPMFARNINQVPAVAEVMRGAVAQQLGVLEAHLADKPFLAGERPTIADITLFSFTQAFRVRMSTTFTAGYPRLTAWYERFEKRPSAVFQAGA
jgi:glutathione S-transferase